MRLEFEITTAADAHRAADIFDSIAAILGAEVSHADTPRTRTRRSKVDVAALYNALADKAGVAPIPADPVAEVAPVAEVIAESAVEIVTPAVEAAPPIADEPAPVAEVVADAPAKTRAEVESEIRTLAMPLGILWVREHGAMKYGKQKLSEVTDAQIAAIHAAVIAATAGNAA
jgi:hypothetical protein